VKKRAYAPGEHGQCRRSKLSEYGSQLREKQKLRRVYGVLERQFRHYFDRATRMEGVTGERLLQLLERRLDNVVYRMGFAPSRAAARQLVRHGHIQVGARKVNIPSFRVKPGDVVAVRRAADSGRRARFDEERQMRPGVATMSIGQAVGDVLTLPSRTEIPIPVEEQMIVELYSK
jgi:small subunit ribosomal protein S4